MKISKISIKNYRSCKSTVFEPNSDLTVLIGPNGSGKTNTLSALRLLGNLVNDSPFRRRFRGEVTTSPTEIKTWFDIDGKKVILTSILHIVTNERNEDEIIDSSQIWYMYDFTGHKKRVSFSLGLLGEMRNSHDIRYRTSPPEEYVLRFLKENGYDKDSLEVMKDVAGFVENISYYGASQFANPANSPISFEVETERGSSQRRGISIRSNHKTFLYDMYQLWKDNSDEYNEYLSIIGPEGIGIIDELVFREIKTSSSTVSVMVGGKTRTKEKQNLLVVPGFVISSETLSPSQLSEGTFKTLALVFYLVTDKGSILLIEEPEVCIHHGLLKSIIEIIKIYSKTKQILISTHSDSVLDKIELENVRVVRKSSKGTTISNLSKNMNKSEIKALRTYLDEEGSLGEYWKHGDLETND